jgi:hypothetical protein
MRAITVRTWRNNIGRFVLYSPRSLAELGRVRRVLPSNELKITTLPEKEMVCNGYEGSEFARKYVIVYQLPNTDLIWALNIPFNIPQRAFPIVSMAQYRTNDPPLRTTQRAPRSCRSCASRKVKCDKAVPCSTCIKRGEADACVREVVIVRGEVITYVADWITSNEITPHLYAP